MIQCRTWIVMVWFDYHVELPHADFAQRREFMWYNFGSLKLGPNILCHKLEPNYWLENLYHMSVDIFELNNMINDDQDTTVSINHINCWSDAHNGEGHALKVRSIWTCLKRFHIHMVCIPGQKVDFNFLLEPILQIEKLCRMIMGTRRGLFVIDNSVWIP